MPPLFATAPYADITLRRHYMLLITRFSHPYDASRALIRRRVQRVRGASDIWRARAAHAAQPLCFSAVITFDTAPRHTLLLMP